MKCACVVDSGPSSPVPQQKHLRGWSAKFSPGRFVMEANSRSLNILSDGTISEEAVTETYDCAKVIADYDKKYQEVLKLEVTKYPHLRSCYF